VFKGKTIHIGNIVKDYRGSYDSERFTIKITYYNTAIYNFIREQEEISKKKVEEENARRQLQLEQKKSGYNEIAITMKLCKV